MYKKDNRSCRMVSFILLLIAILTFFVGCENVQKTENGEGTKDGEGSQGENENTEYIITQHSDDYYIKWAVPDIGGFDVKDEWIDRLNAKLEAEGYQFGIKLIRIKQEHGGNETITEYENYHNKVSLCGADIVFTGEEPVGKNYAESAMINGEYMDLTDKIRNSQIYELQPEVIWDSISYDGKIFMLPSETMQDGLKLMLLADSTCKNIMEKEYHGNLLELEHIVSPENKFFYTFADLSFAVGFGYYYDSVRGVIITKDGRIANPFEIDDIVEWMQMVNR